MNTIEKIFQLKQIITNNLIPIIGDQCVLLDAPYHINTGDLLIWEGEKQFLKSNGIKLLYTRSCDTFNFNDIPSNVTILLNGGGNFGDIWRYFQTFKLKVVEKYPNNKIIFLPQSVEYSDLSFVKNDSLILSKHKNLYICVRDKASKQFIEKYFTNPCILLPDMAFCIDIIKLRKLVKKSTINNNRTLFLKRLDKESSNECTFNYVKNLYEIHDWPSFENIPLCYTIIRRIRHMESISKRYMYKLMTIWLQRIEDYYMSTICLPHIIKSGIQFLTPYSKIYTTRLHVAILSILLGKENICIIDNSYGKNKRFYQQWLSDLDTIEYLDKK